MTAPVPPRPAAGAVSVVLALASWATLVWLGVTAPARTHPLVYFGLIFLGAGSFALLLAGAGALTARSRSLAGRLTPSFVTGARNLVLAMWWCAIVVDVLGCLIVVGTGGRGGTAPLTASTVVTAFVVAAVTVTTAGATSFSVRRAYRLSSS
ncbi:hypothetical protein QRX60_06890 [Amycolatopsis mongoliensis]|uniref:Uncharacterized protein n=1 Tax=Amycolatopsis mongoliensis TaxID=715475 RepID=A0A9Y2JV81_9PSEU|nr:hypothetical protein [Amycolatopsis sp. 4-36]WIY03574.1 hypothetical protein QRX60_06890 [Amycolatopsis sp. 4-36]